LSRAPVSKARAVRPKKTKSAEELEIPKLLNIGYGNVLVASRVIAVVSSQSAPMRRLREEASERGKLIDATQGRRTRSVVITDSDHIVLSAVNPETLSARLVAGGDAA
jgi:regulator of extracellular matrix RemA (YlzA/DUF370 family)